MTRQQGKALNLRPVPEDLRQALRWLAKAEGMELYAYTIGVLEDHVKAQYEIRMVAPALDDTGVPVPTSA